MLYSLFILSFLACGDEATEQEDSKAKEVSEEVKETQETKA